VTDQAIEESLLPVWLRRRNYFRQTALQKPHPLCQQEVLAPTDKEMDVIGHDNITTDGDSALLSQFGKGDKLRMHFGARQQFLSMMSIKRNEKERRIIPLEHKFQSRRSVWHLQ